MPIDNEFRAHLELHPEVPLLRKPLPAEVAERLLQELLAAVTIQRNRLLWEDLLGPMSTASKHLAAAAEKVFGSAAPAEEAPPRPAPSKSEVRFDIRVEHPSRIEDRAKPEEIAVALLEAMLQAITKPNIWFEMLGTLPVAKGHLRVAAERVFGKFAPYTDLAGCIEALRAAGFYVARSQTEATAVREEEIDSLKRLRALDAERIVISRQLQKTQEEEVEALRQLLSNEIVRVDDLLYEDADIIHALVDERVQSRREFNSLSWVFVRKSKRQKELDDSKGSGPEDELTELERRVVGALTTRPQDAEGIAKKTGLDLGLVRWTLAGAALCGSATKTWEGYWVLPGPTAYSNTRSQPSPFIPAGTVLSFSDLKPGMKLSCGRPACVVHKVVAVNSDEVLFDDLQPEWLEARDVKGWTLAEDFHDSGEST